MLNSWISLSFLLWFNQWTFDTCKLWCSVHWTFKWIQLSLLNCILQFRNRRSLHFPKNGPAMWSTWIECLDLNRLQRLLEVKPLLHSLMQISGCSIARIVQPERRLLVGIGQTLFLGKWLRIRWPPWAWRVASNTWGNHVMWQSLLWSCIFYR